MPNNIHPIYTNLMIDHLQDNGDPALCPVCRVINAYGCDVLEAPDGRYFSCLDCDCEERREIVEAVMSELGFATAVR